VGNQVEISRLSKRMEELLYREEMMWLQWSQISWHKEGDRNTKFFHRKAQRGKKNKIGMLMKEDGVITKDRHEMEGMTTKFFQELYVADTSVAPEPLLHLFQPCVTDEMNFALCQDFSNEEIGDALFQMGPLKAPGPDGFPMRFFQRNWEVLKVDIIKSVTQFFCLGKDTT
jgi:hypothetical protein